MEIIEVPNEKAPENLSEAQMIEVIQSNAQFYHFVCIFVTYRLQYKTK